MLINRQFALQIHNDLTFDLKQDGSPDLLATGRASLWSGATDLLRSQPAHAIVSDRAQVAADFGDTHRLTAEATFSNSLRVTLTADSYALWKEAFVLQWSVKNVGAEPIFSEFEVTNPQTKRKYRVAIRGRGLGENYCSCPDFAVNTLGTCKHIEFTLAKLHRRPGAKAAFRAGFHPEYSEIYVRYGAQRQVIGLQPAEHPPRPRGEVHFRPRAWVDHEPGSTAAVRPFSA